MPATLSALSGCLRVRIPVAPPILRPTFSPTFYAGLRRIWPDHIGRRVWDKSMKLGGLVDVTRLRWTPTRRTPLPPIIRISDSGACSPLEESFAGECARGHLRRVR